MFGKGLWGIIAGAITLGVLIYMYTSNQQDMSEANDIRANGWYYNGTSQITQEQFNEIKKYDGFHGGFVKVVEVESLTVNYGFGAKENIEFLARKDWDWTEKSIGGVGGSALLICLIIPVIAIFYGLSTLGSKQ